MRTIKISEEFQIPGTDTVLEKGDIVKVEDSSKRKDLSEAPNVTRHQKILKKYIDAVVDEMEWAGEYDNEDPLVAKVARDLLGSLERVRSPRNFILILIDTLKRATL
jgi:hypothetical protein